MSNPHKRLNVKATIDLLTEVANGSLDTAYRVKTARDALWNHLRAIATDKTKRRGRRK